MRIISVIIFTLFLQINCYASSGMLQGVGAQTSCQSLRGSGFYSNLNYYYNFDGSGTIATGTILTPSVGTAGTVVNPNNLGMSFVNGNTAQGIKFGGDDYIKFDPVYNALTTYTVSLWVKPGASTLPKTILQRGESSNCFYNPNITLISSTGELRASESGCSSYGLITTTTISLTKWTHVVVARSSGVSKLYINGVLKGSTSNIGNETYSGRITIGASWRNNSTYDSFTDANIDDVAIMTVALNDTQVADLYASQNCNR